MATSEGVAEIWSLISGFQKTFDGSGDIVRHRSAQANAWMWSEVGEGLRGALRTHHEVRRVLPAIEADVAQGRMAPTAAARLLLEAFQNND